MHTVHTSALGRHPTSPWTLESGWENAWLVHVLHSHQFLWQLVHTVSTPQWAWSPAPSGLSSPNGDETEWLKLSLGLYVCGHVPTDIFTQEPVLECMFIRNKNCISKNCSCPCVSIAYFRPAGKNGILHLCLPVVLSVFLSVSLPSACFSIFSVWFSGALWMVEKDFKVLLDVSSCLHNAGTYLHLYIPVWVIPWVVEEYDRPGWKQVSVFV